MDELFNKLIQKCDDNNYTSEEIKTIKKAYEFACHQHEGMKRKNGEEYISHPLNVALICAELNTDAITIESALLHETILHGSSSFEELGELFGDDVKNIITSLTKVNKLHLLEDNESTSIYLRKVLVALCEDPRVLILKLAGRVHNLKTREGLDEEKQKQKALETQNVLIPIAHRLGINYLKSELEDLCFRILKSETYDEIENGLPAPRKELEESLSSMIEDISEVLRANSINFEIKGRVKSVSSLYNKLANKGKTWAQIYDILGIRIICEQETECYLIIGLIHSMYRPIPGRFKDYIAMPKNNSYQSLHTGVFGTNELPIEVQVRTKEMNEIAEHGIASHWSYKEHSKVIQNVMEQKLQMFRNIIEANSDEATDESFQDSLNEVLSNSIYVFTPKGDVVELPDGSTPLDFAYRIHSKVGDTTVGAIVNDTMVTLDYKLKDNDIIKIMTNPNSSPNKDWLNIVKTTQAKNKIKAYFSKKDREEYVERGKELIERELRRQHISFADAMTEEHINKVMKDLKVGSYEEILESIGSLRYTALYVVNLLFEDKKNVQDVLLDKVMNNNTIQHTNCKNDVIVDGCDDILVNLASCCKPVYGDEIIGYITKGQGINVHKKDCINLKDINERLIPVSWNDTKENKDTQYIVKLLVTTNGIRNNVLDIVTKATLRNTIINSVNEVNKNNTICYDLLIKVHNKNDLDLFIDELKTLSFVVDVKRY